jgi:hypothetical protein
MAMILLFGSGSKTGVYPSEQEFTHKKKAHSPVRLLLTSRHLIGADHQLLKPLLPAVARRGKGSDQLRLGAH